MMIVPAWAETVLVAVPADPEHFNPGITTASHTHAVSNSIYNGLVSRDRERHPVPDLATDWTISDDELAYTFSLADAKWHDGKPNQNAFIDRFNRSFRTAVLDAHLFNSVSEAQAAVDHWVTDYNQYQSHESLGNVPLTQYLPCVFSPR